MPAPRKCERAPSSSSRLRAVLATAAHISPSASASCSLRPPEPPVTSAIRPRRSMSSLTCMAAMLIEFSAVTTLVMFSVGLHSTAMLVKLLAETPDELRVHHIRMANREGRADAEQAAVESIVGWCRTRYRPFRYSESALDFRELEAIPIDYVCIAFVACQVAKAMQT